MIYLDEIKFSEIIVHKIGNKNSDEGIQLSERPFRINESISELILHYFFTPFKHREFYQFTHSDDLKYNEIYNYAVEIFKSPQTVFQYSEKIAAQLYEASSHPNIKSGELYIAYFRDCIVEGEMIDGIGIFKSENKETYLKIYSTDNGYGIDSDTGININKLDKGCIIFNTMEESGFLVAAVDNTSRNSEAVFWTNDFLNIKRRKDEYYKTEAALKMCKSFIEEVIPDKIEISKAEQSNYLNNSAKFFKENDKFDVNHFENEVFQSPELIESFRTFKHSYEKESGDRLGTNFDIADDAVRRQAKIMKSAIQLDKNFKISIMGNSELIKRGYDRTLQMHYYTLYFNEEF